MTATASARARPADDRAPPDPAAARLVISLLGEVAVVVDGRPVPELAAPRMQRLWARLVLARGHRLLRNQLACELWPQSSDAQARTNLRKLLHDLRRSLPAEPELVDVDSRAVRWCAGSMVWVDVLAFTDALAKGELREAVGSYGGVLLPDCDDDIWVEAERERLRRLAVETLAGLAADADVEHRDSDVVGYARDLLRIDPLHEPACRLLMRALVRRGERSEALRTYDRLAGMLAGELGLTPEPATTRWPSSSAPSLGDRTGPALVGRSRDGGGDRGMAQAVGGRARLLCVTGEAGIGKSRLVEELARRVAADGHAVVYGRAYEAAGRPPWGPVIDWLRSEPVRSGLDALDEVWLAELARLLPELRTAHPGIPAVPPEADVGGRRHLLDAVCRGSCRRRGPCSSCSTTFSGATPRRSSCVASWSRALRRRRFSSRAPSATRRSARCIRSRDCAGTSSRPVPCRSSRSIASTGRRPPRSLPGSAGAGSVRGRRTDCGRRPRATRSSSSRPFEQDSAAHTEDRSR